MKKENMQTQRSRQRDTKKKRPENKDELDSRKNEEQGLKGDDITHNKKEVKSNIPRPKH
jgi:hypothetical protein